MRGIQEAQNLIGKRVLVRIDIDDSGKSMFPAESSKKTILFLKEAGARVILLGHVGRDKEESAKKIFEILSKEIEINFISDLVGDISRKSINKMHNGDVVLLENVRNDEREIINDESFSKELSNLADIYVNEAFAVSHRRHSSVVGVPKFLPSFAGFQLQEEIKALSQALVPKQPSLFILSGAKIETKLPLIEKFVSIYSNIFVGGVLANNLFKAKGFEVGVSVTSNEDIDVSPILNNDKVIIPVDVVVENGDKCSIKKSEEVLPEEKIIDAGPDTVKILKDRISSSRCVLWNGPLGEYERGFDTATKEVALSMSKSSAHTIVGGGDTLSAIAKLNLEDRYSFVSTGGGAMLEFLLKGTLPGIEALN
jgi:3-phosphoglycerate kinase